MKAISAYSRPHIEGDTCWCRPKLEHCHCGECGDGEFYLHRQLDTRPDHQPRMAVFSDQVYGDGPSIGVSI